MGSFDRRKSRKMRQRRGQVKKKARAVRHAAEVAKSRKPARKSRAAPAAS